MNIAFVSRAAAGLALCCFVLSTAAAFADDKVVRIGVLTDMFGPYADMSGANSVTATKMAVEDSGLLAKGWTIEVLSADHRNKIDVAISVAQQWIDGQHIDVIADTPNSAVALAVTNIVKEKNVVLLNSSAPSADLTGKSCTQNAISFAYDSYMLTNGPAKALVRAGGSSWFFVTANDAFGNLIEGNMSSAVAATGGEVVGAAKHVPGNADFLPLLSRAQSSRAKIIALANAGGDTTAAIRQASDFHIGNGAQKLFAPSFSISDVNTIGLNESQGIIVTESFYWDLNDKTRNWSRRFQKLSQKSTMPSMTVAGVYAGVLHYLKTLEALGGNPHDGAKVVLKMKGIPTDDPLFGQGPIRMDGRRLIPAYVFEVKKPAESRYPWDYYKPIATIAAEDAAVPLSASECPLAKLAPPTPIALAQPQASPAVAAQAPPPPAQAQAVAVAPVAQPAPTAPAPAAGAPSAFPSSPEFGRRVALVIGNSAYKDAPALTNPTRDAAAIASTLQGLGFQSVTLQTDLGREKMIDALRNFARQAALADWAVVYFAGHGMEVGGVNYLMPVDATVETDLDMPFAAVPLDQVLNATDRARKLRLVILDACRSNPFANKMVRTASVSSRGVVERGFGRVEPDAGTLVVYAAKDGQTASDGSGPHSPFTSALLKNIQIPGVEVRRVLDNVRDDVQDATRQSQLPYTYGSVSGKQDFYFLR